MEARVVRPLRHNGMPYNGINVLILWAAAVEGGFSSPFWMTYRQAQELGAQVRKGAHGNLVVYARTITVAWPRRRGFDLAGRLRLRAPVLRRWRCLRRRQWTSPAPPEVLRPERPGDSLCCAEAALIWSP